MADTEVKDTRRIYAHSQDEALRAAGATLGRVVTPSR
jgi:hypothetical protein